MGKISNESLELMLNELMVKYNKPLVAFKVDKVATELTKTVKVSNGMNNKMMISLLKDNMNDSEKLLSLFTEYEELFIYNIQGVKDSIKFTILPTIQTKYPNATILPKNPKVKHVVLNT